MRITAARLTGVVLVALMAANCSQQKQSSGIDPRYGVKPSPRVVADGEPVPKGGGRQIVGKPYMVAGRTYVPQENPNYAGEGLASWYGSQFHGRLTANGEIFDRYAIAAAHPTMPLPSYARVTNLQNKRSIIVRVNDRGPYHENRIMDVSQRVAEALDFAHHGTARVRVEYVGRAPIRGSDDRILMASLRTDGQPALLPGVMPTMVADAGGAMSASPARAGLTNTAQAHAPRTSLGFDNPDSDDVEEATAVVAQGDGLRGSLNVVALAEAGAPAWAAAAGKVVAGVPLPPERPFDLGTIPNAANPVPVPPVRGPAEAQVLPPARPVLAGLYFAPPGPVASGFSKGSPFESLAPQKFVSLRAQH